MEKARPAADAGGCHPPATDMAAEAAAAKVVVGAAPWR